MKDHHKVCVSVRHCILCAVITFTSRPALEKGERNRSIDMNPETEREREGEKRNRMRFVSEGLEEYKGGGA